MSQETPQKKTRAYHSPRRQEQAVVTRDRIVSAALKQLQEKGYADMTLESIAREAGVAPQTVYAVCGSKKGVLAAILENSVESWKYDKYRDMIMEVPTGEERVKAMGHFLSLLLENLAPGFQLMRGLGVVSPDLAEVEVDNEMMIYEKNQKQIVRMAEDGLLRPDLDVETATDMVWAISAPGVHRRLTKLRGWSPERYSAFMAAVIGFLLLGEGAELSGEGEILAAGQEGRNATVSPAPAPRVASSEFPAQHAARSGQNSQKTKVAAKRKKRTEA